MNLREVKKSDFTTPEKAAITQQINNLTFEELITKYTFDFGADALVENLWEILGKDGNNYLMDFCTLDLYPHVIEKYEGTDDEEKIRQVLEIELDD